MIPVRVKLTGFLSYKDSQEIRFDGSPLWMLSGVNGSGKSTIFDAITYALFGHHRGGSQGAVELINKDSTSLSVEFDFRLDHHSYQAKRTLKRTSKGGATGTQQLYRWETTSGNGKGRWVAVPDTSKKADFDAWVRENIGLNFETFTSSVLLLQGRAEKLLDSKPSGRAEVLAGIVDLERYQRLHEKADSRRRSRKAELEAVKHQYEAVPEVTDEQLGQAQQQIEQTAESRQQAFAKLQQTQAWEYQARQWSDLQHRHSRLKDQLQGCLGLLADAKDIEQQYRRYRELREVLPHVNTVMMERSKIEESGKRTDKLTQEYTCLNQQQGEAEHEFDQTKKKKDRLRSQFDEEQQRLDKTKTELSGLQLVLAQLKEFTTQQSKLNQLENELKELPDDPEKELRDTQQQHRDLDQLSRVFPLLKQFSRDRQTLRDALANEARHAREAEQIKAKGEELNKQLEQKQRDLAAVTSERERADQETSVARAMMTQAQEARTAFEELSGSKVCRQCGQPLTESHYAQEHEKRIQECESTTKRLQECEGVLRAAREKEQHLRNEVNKLEGELPPLREKWTEHDTSRKQARHEADRAEKECHEIYHTLVGEFRERIADDGGVDWTKTNYPTAEDLDGIRRKVNDLTVVGRRLPELQRIVDHWRDLRGQAKSVRESLERVRATLPAGEPSEIRQRETVLKTDESTLNESLIATRRAIQENEKQLDRLSQGIAKRQEELTEFRKNLEMEEKSRGHHRENIDRALTALPETWRETVQHAGLTAQLQWKVEAEELAEQKIEQRHESLINAQRDLESIRQKIADVEQEIGVIPEESRRDPESIKALLRELGQQRDECDERWQMAKQEHARLVELRKRREMLREQVLELEREHNVYSLISQLLGRDRLQRYLVRQAERQIVDYANAVLDRLSAGELRLQLCGSDDGTDPGRALELEAYNRTTGGSPINVAFLSGSQRFRVAVSLAVGMGQYASRQHRPIESVIIDEGFGCLDRQGRQGMIQELQNLRGQLNCILLVSHQEEFADAFPDGYRFELEEGATRVTRFQR